MQTTREITHHSPEMKESLRLSLLEYSLKQLEVLEDYYLNKRPDLPDGLELVQKEIKARKENERSQNV